MLDAPNVQRTFVYVWIFCANRWQWSIREEEV